MGSVSIILAHLQKIQITLKRRIGLEVTLQYVIALPIKMDLNRINYIQSEKIALVYFLFYLRLASDAKLKFVLISAATLSV